MPQPLSDGCRIIPILKSVVISIPWKLHGGVLIITGDTSIPVLISSYVYTAQLYCIRNIKKVCFKTIVDLRHDKDKSTSR